MSNVIKTATNKFTKGLVMDFSPENTSNEVLTHALNATLLTFNGNEMSLQNDMGNGRVETAFLPEGYIPVGTCEYGGIIYIVSYNPLEDKSQIGCFPSPERNISNEELGESDKEITNDNFQDIISGDLKQTTYTVILRNSELNSGDKFIISANNDIYKEKILDLKQNISGIFLQIDNPIIKLNIVSIEDSGKIVYLNDTLRLYDKTYDNNDYQYYIVGETQKANSISKIDIDAYRNILSSGYNVFKSKISGKLAILAELITIDSYSVTHSIEPIDDSGSYQIKIHTDVTPELTKETYNIKPKLKYYCLKDSKLYIQQNNTKFEYFKGDWDKLTLNLFYSPIPHTKKILDCGIFNFHKPNTYHGRMILLNYDNLNWDSDNNIHLDEKEIIYTKFDKNKLHKFNKSQLKLSNGNWNDYWNNITNVKYYYYDPKGDWTIVEDKTKIDITDVYYVMNTKDVFKDAERDTTHQSSTLFEFKSDYYLANDNQLKDSTTEIFWYKPITIYKLATSEELQDPNNKSNIRIKEGELWVGVNSIDRNQIENNTIYFLMTDTTIIESLGTDPINREDYITDDFYFASQPLYTVVTDPEKIELYFNFTEYPKENTAPWGLNFTLYYKDSNASITYSEATTELKLNTTTTLYSKETYINTNLEYIQNINISRNEFFIKSLSDIYVSSKNFIPNKNYNWIYGDPDKHAYVEGDDTSEKIATYPINIYKVGNFIPDETNEYKYDDVILADIKIPEEIYTSSNKVPMKYDYTIVPCMEYGKLAHLAVSNTIDFSKLMDFNASTFNTWKYRIDEKQLTLTFGAEIYDTGQTNKVDALILEFYDLWGFVGSLEITNKKSYSGVFTKILRIDELNQLNNKKITNDNYTNDYVHNSLITLENGEVLKYNGSNISIDPTEGVSDKSFNDCTMLRSNMIYGIKSYLRQKNSDGKSYTFTRKEDFFLFTSPIYNEYFYKKLNYNDIINPKLNFILTYKLENSGSYKPYEDEVVNENGSDETGGKISDNFTNGYYHHDEMDGEVITKNSDYRNFNDYANGSYSSSNELSLTKFYKYLGLTKLYLEIGLREEYNNFNITYDPKINEKFKCTLQLLSEKLINESDPTLGYRTYLINSVRENESEEQLLNYVGFKNSINNDILTMNNNFIKFIPSKEIPAETNGNIKQISDLSAYNFLNNINTEDTEGTDVKNYIPIDYEFIVGHNAKIINIKSTQIPFVTVTPLCNNIGESYNYEDFSIYKTTDSENNTYYLPDKMYYNGGTATEEQFGLCQMINIKGNTVAEECNNILDYSSTAKDITTPGRLNINYLSQVVPEIGKLTFCMPHVHYGFDEANGVNIHLAKNKTDLNISSDTKKVRFDRNDPITLLRSYYKDNGKDNDTSTVSEADHSQGIAVSNEYFSKPKYNMVLNTYKSLEKQSEFISTLDFELIEGRQKVQDLHGDDPSEDFWEAWFVSGEAKYDGAEANYTFKNRKFTGLTSEQITIFNQKLLTTMKGVYAYNPNYAMLAVNIGDAIIENKQLQFISYLISSDASLSEEVCLNDYVGIGNITFSKYFELLNKYSEISIKESDKFKGQINFTADLTFCGGGIDKYLISQLTYNIPLPLEYQQELLFQQNDKILVKHDNKNSSSLNGKINKKTLYGFYHDENVNKLIELDVSNYHIDHNGELWIKYIDKYKKSGYNKE